MLPPTEQRYCLCQEVREIHCLHVGGKLEEVQCSCAEEMVGSRELLSFPDPPALTASENAVAIMCWFTIGFDSGVPS